LHAGVLDAPRLTGPQQMLFSKSIFMADVRR